MPTPFDLRLSDRRSPNLTHIRLHGCDNHHRFAVLLGSGGSFAEGTYALQQTIFTSCNDYSITSSARGEQLRGVSMPSAVAVDVAVGVDAGKHRGPWPHIHVFHNGCGTSQHEDRRSVRYCFRFCCLSGPISWPSPVRGCRRATGRRITASNRCAVFARLFWSAEGPSFASVAGAGAGGVTTEDAGRRRGSRRDVSQTGRSEALGSDADAARPNSSERPDSGSVRPGRSRGEAARGD